MQPAEPATPTPGIHEPVDPSVLEAVLETTAPGPKKAPTMATPPDDPPAPTPQPQQKPPATPPAPAVPPYDEDPWAFFEQMSLGIGADEVRAAVAAAPEPPDAPTPASSPIAPEAAATALDIAAAEADTHTSKLADHPEWQHIQTIRGALRHLWDLTKEQANSHWEALRADFRFQGLWKTASIRACEAISAYAATLAHRLQGDLPTAAALLKLSDAALTYSTVTAAEPTPSPPSAAASPPLPYATRDDAVRAAREVTTRFQAWTATPMGQDLVGSGHRRVNAFRDAWQQLPPHDTAPGRAAGPYGDVTETAKALLTAATKAARFAPADLQTLQALATAADTHAARLSVTLPPGTSTPPRRAVPPAPRVAAPAPPTARTPRASA
ncbi:hypothetical protein [Streptomyces sp. NPDC001717]|uniref:hypothetical protein n=1 Tax=Streptomyces sp. NPDC001717 TaxID=3364604 RepID=UPI00367E16C1